MAKGNQGRGDSDDLMNEGDRFTFPLLVNEVPHSGNRENGPLSSMQLQVSSSPTGNFPGEPAHCIGHDSAGSLSTMMTNVTQHSSCSLHKPVIPGGFYGAETNGGTNSSSLSRIQSYDLIHNVRKQDGLSGRRSQLETSNGISDVRRFSALDRSQSYDLNHNVPKQVGPSGSCSQLDMNKAFIQAESSDVRSFSALNRRQSYDLNRGVQIHDITPDGESDVNIRSHGRNWVMSQVDSSNIDGLFFLSLGHTDIAGSTLESNASEGNYNASSLSFPPSKQETSHGPFNHQDLPSSTIGRLALSNNAYGSSESGISGMPRLPSEATTTNGIRQQLSMMSNAVSHFHCPTSFPTLGTSSKKNKHDQASQSRIMHAPSSGSFSEICIAPDNAVSSSSRTGVVGDSNVSGKRSLQRGSSITSEPPRKLIHHNTVGPSHFLVNPSPPQSSTFTSTSRQPFQSPKTAPRQNTKRTRIPTFTPPSNHFSVDAHAKTIPAPQQTSILKNAAASTNTTLRPGSPSWYRRPSAVAPVQIANSPLHSLERHTLQLGAAGNVHGGAAVRKLLPNQTTQKGSVSRTAVEASREKALLRILLQRQTSGMHHIRSAGVYKPEAKGVKCLVCKRDLAYTAEGRLRLSPSPPEVAVLPCGHVFHDHCLAAITPQDQRANPPCISCSLNDSA